MMPGVATQKLSVATAAPAACLHCGGPLGSADGRFCCAGCAQAFDLIRDAGMASYYARRVLDPAAAAPRPSNAPQLDIARHVRTRDDGTCEMDLAIDGLHCAACVWLIETILARAPDVARARLNVSTRRLHVVWRGAPAQAQALAAQVAALGYRVAPWDPAVAKAARDLEERDLLRALGVAGFAAANVMLLSVAVWSGHMGEMGPATRDLLHWVSGLIALPALLYAGQPFFRSAAAALRAGRTNMDVPISIGITLAAGVSLYEVANGGRHAYFDSAITLVFFLLIGRYLEHRARGRARSAMAHLLALRGGAVARLHGDGTTEFVAPDALVSGDRIAVAAGERIGADGRVTRGAGAVDASLVTGESLPQQVVAGSPVHAGMVNLGGPLEIEVTAAGERTLLAEMVRLLEAAEHGRARHVALADRVARAYAPVVHAAALATFVGWLLAGAGWHASLLTAVTVLIITCPCALALAVPAVQIVASGALFRRGILLKSPTALERLREVDTVVFDKTGTLTLGHPELIATPAWSADDLRLAAGLAQRSRHPLSRALVRACPQARAAEGVEELPGEGLRAATPAGEARLGSRRFCGVRDDVQAVGLELWLRRPDGALIEFRFADPVRADAAATVAELRRRGLSVLLLSGDRQSTVAALARDVGIDAWLAELTPQQKVARLGELAALGRRTLMVGDGLNDAPALGAAHVSVSPTSGSDLAQSAADAVFRGERLGPVLDLLRMAQLGDRLVRQNLIFALGYNLLAVPLAIAGFVTPLIAALAMSSSSLVVIGNALRASRETGR